MLCCLAKWGRGAGKSAAIDGDTVRFALSAVSHRRAGDVKLLSVAGCFLTAKETILCLGLSFALGAVLSLAKMIAEKNFLERMKYLLWYIADVFTSGEWKFYEEDRNDRQRRKKGKIHFSIPVLLGMVVYKGGIYW